MIVKTLETRNYRLKTVKDGLSRKEVKALKIIESKFLRSLGSLYGRPDLKYSFITLLKKELRGFQENICSVGVNGVAETSDDSWIKNPGKFLMHNDIESGWTIPHPHSYNGYVHTKTPLFLSLANLGIYLEKMQFGILNDESFRIPDSAFRKIFQHYQNIEQTYVYEGVLKRICSPERILERVGGSCYKFNDNNQHIYRYFKERHGRVKPVSIKEPVCEKCEHEIGKMRSLLKDACVTFEGFVKKALHMGS